MARYCAGCGHELKEKALFCDKCGRKAVQAADPAGAAPPQQRAASAYVAATPIQPGPKRKTRPGLWIALSLAAVFVVFAIWILIPDAAPVAAFPDALKAGGSDAAIHCSYTAPDTIIPANYRSMDSVVFLQCSTDGGTAKLMVTVEIPEFTQKFEQMIEVTRAETELLIRPPLLDGAAKSLNSSKDAQLNVTVTNMDTDKVVLKDSKPVKLYSRFDMQWMDKDGTPYYENILAWVTPEAPEIKDMLRVSADCANELTGGGLNAIIGYQQNSDWSKEDITYTQVFSMMYALSSKYKVKYIMSPFSSTDSSLQRIKTPAEVINSAGGLCAETAVTMASAIQATNMHAVLILLPGHMQVAVETWTNSGEYYLIETTALDAARTAPKTKKWNSVIWYMDKDQWNDYLDQDGVVAIDCDLASQLHIQSID